MYIADYKNLSRKNATLRVDPHHGYTLTSKQMSQGFCAYCLSHSCGDNDVANRKGLKKQKAFRKMERLNLREKFEDFSIL